MYQIYKYKNNINGKIYIGLTSKSLKERAGSNGINYRLCTHFYEDILKFGLSSFSIEVLEDGIQTLELANEREEYYIKTLNSQDPEIGYNIQPGGSKFIMNESIRKLIGERVKSSNRFIINNAKAHCKGVIGISLKDGSLREFESMTAASEEINASRGSLGNCCRRYNGNMVLKGYVWLFKNDYDPTLDYVALYKQHRDTVTYGSERNKKISDTKKKLSKNYISKNLKAVVRINLDTKEKKVYPSVKEAAQSNKIKATSNITLVCNGQRKTAGGYFWKWK